MFPLFYLIVLCKLKRNIKVEHSLGLTQWEEQRNWKLKAMSMIRLSTLKHRLMYVEEYTAQFPQSRQGGVFLPTVITFFWVRCCKYSYGYIYPVIFIPKAAANTGRMKAADWGRNSLTWCIPSADFSPTPPPVPCRVTHHHKLNIFTWSIFAALSSSVSIANTDPILF